jgi:hypothetical protein
VEPNTPLLVNPRSIGLSQSMRRIPSTTRILLTGTPIQNNLMVRTLVAVATGAGSSSFSRPGLCGYVTGKQELWSLFDYTCKGQLLGTIHQFGRQFEQPIKYATYKCASAEEKQLVRLPVPFHLHAALDVVSRRLTSLACTLATSHTSCRSSCVIFWRPISCAARRRTCSTPTAALPRLTRVTSRRLLHLPRRKGSSKHLPLG